MTKTITRLFDNYNDASNAVRDLESIGISHSDISIVAHDRDHVPTQSHTGDATNDHIDRGVNAEGDVDRGVSTGAAIGGVGGLLAGLGLLAIPGLGPIVAAGWLVATIAGAGIGAAGGAATGGIVGALKNAGHSDDEANVYAEGLRRGATLVSARVPDDTASKAEEVLKRHKPVDAATRGSDYRDSGWERFDETAPAYKDDHVEVKRSALDDPARLN